MIVIYNHKTVASLNDNILDSESQNTPTTEIRGALSNLPSDIDIKYEKEEHKVVHSSVDHLTGLISLWTLGIIRLGQWKIFLK